MIMTHRADAGVARRAITSIVLLLQLVLVGAIPMADALIDSGPLGPHIEAADAAPCAPVHDHQKCQLCRHNGEFGTAVAATSVAVTAPTRIRATTDSPDHIPPATYLGGVHQPRAPPSV